MDNIPPSPGNYCDRFWSAADGLQIVARQWTVNDPQGVVLLIHGLGDHSGRWEQVADTLNRADYTVLAPDLRGHGRSQGRRGHIGSFEKLLDDIDLAMQNARAAVPGSPCFIYGQSLGGLLTLFFALRRQPDLCGLIASSAALQIAMPAPAWKVGLGKVLRKTLPHISLNSGLDLQELSDDPQVTARVRSDRLRHQRVTPEGYFGMLESGHWCLQNAARLPCPALVMHGCLDRITDHRASIEFVEASAASQLSLWPKGKHELHSMSNRQEVLATVIEFQNRCNRGDSPSTG